jgi:Tol biopolymer transport system component
MNVSRVVLAIVAVALVDGSASGQTTARVSIDPTSADGNGLSIRPSLSGDGGFVAFESAATNLIAGDTNGVVDVFLRELGTGTVIRVSVANDGSEADGDSHIYRQGVSADGRFVVFESIATNLVSADTNGVWDVFARDTVSGTTERVSVDSFGGEANRDCAIAAISADGRYVAFTSAADNLAPNKTNFYNDVFVHDRTAGTTTLASSDSSGNQGNSWSVIPSISGDGRYVAFYGNASNLVPGDNNGTFDAFVHDMTTGTTTRISVDSAGNEADSFSHGPAISTDGRYVAFCSVASNLVASDTNGVQDVFVRDLQSGTTEIVSRGFDGSEANGPSFPSGTSDDGSHVVFTSSASNLVANDTNGADDTFVVRRTTASTTRVNVHSDGTEANASSIGYAATISGDGLLVAFASVATNLVDDDTNGLEDVFVHEACSTIASRSTYGAGFPGTNGVPSLTARSNPVFGTSLTVDLASSSTLYTAAVLFVGYQQAQIHSAWGGDLLLLPAITSLIALPPTGTSLTGDLPDDPAFCGFEVDLQAIEADAGAVKGVSFTQGLQLILGD